jgi:serine/threonine-protein kinase SRPK3
MCILTWDELIEQHVDLLGKLPPEWWQRWDARSKSFDEEGVRIHEIVALMGTIEQRFDKNVQEWRHFQRMEEVSEEEKAALIDMLKAMLAFKPGDRTYDC